MTPEQIRQEAEREYPIIIERDFNPLSDGSFDINESAREAYIKGRMKSLEEKEKEIAAYIKVAMKVLEEKEKEIAELVGALKQIFEQYGYECKNYADSCGISFEKWVLDIPTYQTVKQILKKHNP